jgi:hypothetical protein
MRTASKGNWNISGTNKDTGKVIYPFYDGFNTKKEAIEICGKLQLADSKHTYTVIKN